MIFGDANDVGAIRFGSSVQMSELSLKRLFLTCRPESELAAPVTSVLGVNAHGFVVTKTTASIGSSSIVGSLIDASMCPVVIGAGAVGTGTESVTIACAGNNTGDYSIVIGSDNANAADDCVIIGRDAAAISGISHEAIAIGKSALANLLGVAVGVSATASGAGSIAHGYSAFADATNDIAVGFDSTTNGAAAAPAIAFGSGGTSAGVGASAEAAGAIAFGSGGNAGRAPRARGVASIVLGSGYGAVAGPIAESAAVGSIVVGSAGTSGGAAARAVSNASVVLGSGGTSGNGATTTDAGGIAIGAGVSTFNGAIAGLNAIAIGAAIAGGLDGAAATGDYAIAVGVDSIASGDSSVAVGPSSHATGAAAVALGGGCTASGDLSAAVGTGTSVSGLGALAVGIGIRATHNGGITMGEHTGSAAIDSDADNELKILLNGSGTAHYIRTDFVRDATVRAFANNYMKWNVDGTQYYLPLYV